MKKVKRMLLAAAMSAITMGAFPQDQGVSMFIPGCCKTCQMLLVEKDGKEAEIINLISGTAEEETVNGRRYKTLNTSSAGLGTLSSAILGQAYRKESFFYMLPLGFSLHLHRDNSFHYNKT